MPKHAGWAAAQSGKKAWIIDVGATEEKWFIYTCCESIKQLHRARKARCKNLKEGKTL